MAPPEAPQDWNTGEQIRNHTLATSIIHNHSPEGNMVLDSIELARLERFVSDVSSRDELAKDNDWVDEPGNAPGTKAAETHGSLSGFLIARHGTEDPALDERDIEMLRRWFAEGMPCGQSVVR